MRNDDILNTDMLYVWSSISDELFQTIHCHAEYEIFYLKRGDIEYQVEGCLYKPDPGSLLLVPPNSIHGVTVRSCRPYERVSIHLLPELLEKTDQALFLDMFYRPRTYYPNLSQIQIDFLIQSISGCKNMDTPLQKPSLKFRVLSLLTHIYHIYSQSATGSPIQNKRIQSILRYLNSNIFEPLSLAKIAEKFNINKNYINEIFHKETGTTIKQYIQIKRLSLARREIQQGCSAEDAAYKVGFNDYSNFYRAYKAFFGIKPSDKNNEWPQVHYEPGSV
jgi:AraC-like DNA-binding protein